MRNVCFTLNNYTPEEEKNIQAFARSDCVYLIYGREVAPSTGTPHLQGYAELDRQMRVSYLKSNLSCRAHFVNARGSGAENRAYCSKDGDVFEFGVPKSPGRRTDLHLFRDAIMSGKRDHELADAHLKSFARYPKLVRTLRSVCVEQIALARHKCERRVVVYWGLPGVGKTRSVFDQWDVGKIYRVTVAPNRPVYFDGYHGEPVILFDDFNGEVALSYMLQLTDRYLMRVDCRGYFTWNAWSHVYFTSNRHPRDWWPTGRYDAFMRRVTTCEELQ